jgi:hypothetical protein
VSKWQMRRALSSATGVGASSGEECDAHSDGGWSTGERRSAQTKRAQGGSGALHSRASRRLDVFTGSTQAMALDATALSEVRANVLRGMLLFSFL